MMTPEPADAATSAMPSASSRLAASTTEISPKRRAMGPTRKAWQATPTTPAKTKMMPTWRGPQPIVEPAHRANVDSRVETT